MTPLTIPLDQIEPGERLRALDEDYAQLIAASMAEHGQMTPIEVRKGTKLPWRLVSGMHRLRALDLAGIKTAVAIHFESTPDEAELREIDENLCRRELAELDRGAFLARRQEVYERLYPATKHGGKRPAGSSRQSGDMVAGGLTMRFTADAAAKLRLSERVVQRSIQRFRYLEPDVRARVAGTWLADHGAQLDQLGGLAASEQRAVVVALFDAPGGGELAPGSVGEALARVRGIAPAVDPDRAFNGILAAWRKLGAADRRRFVAHLALEGALRNAPATKADAAAQLAHGEIARAVNELQPRSMRVDDALGEQLPSVLAEARRRSAEAA